MGTFKGGSRSYRSIEQNVNILKASYPFKNGYFGTKGQGRSYTRNIVSSNPINTAMDFYEKATYGGIEKTYSKGALYKNVGWYCFVISRNIIVRWNPCCRN